MFNMQFVSIDTIGEIWVFGVKDFNNSVSFEARI